MSLILFPRSGDNRDTRKRIQAEKARHLLLISEHAQGNNLIAVQPGWVVDAEDVYVVEEDGCCGGRDRDFRGRPCGS